MTFIFLAALKMRSSTTPAHKQSGGDRGYSPSVPLSVYRELATQLQSTQDMLDSLKAQNQQLAKQNQQLRQEIEKVVQHVLHLQHVVDSTVASKADSPHPGAMGSKRRPASSPHSMHQTRSPAVIPHASQVGRTGLNAPENIFVEEVDADNYRRRYQEEKTSEISGWGLAIAILLVTFTAFSAGYLLVRPLIANR